MVFHGISKLYCIVFLHTLPQIKFSHKSDDAGREKRGWNTVLAESVFWEKGKRSLIHCLAHPQTFSTHLSGIQQIEHSAHRSQHGRELEFPTSPRISPGQLFIAAKRASPQKHLSPKQQFSTCPILPQLGADWSRLKSKESYTRSWLLSQSSQHGLLSTASSVPAQVVSIWCTPIWESSLWILRLQTNTAALPKAATPQSH